jgi:hypothetical protein
VQAATEDGHAVAVTDPKAAELTIFTLPDLLQGEYRRFHGRMTDVVAFELPITDEGFEFLESQGSAYQPRGVRLGP